MARRKKGKAVHGWLVLDKPAGMTSTQAVGAVRRLFDARKAGHAGTLDPLATGILPDRARRSDQDRAIRRRRRESATASRCAGASRPTPTTRKAQRRRTSDMRARARRDRGAAAAVHRRDPADAAGILGHQDRRRPRLRPGARGRGGRAGRRAPCTSTCSTLIDMPDADTAVFEARCGKGTYVRALARDMGRTLGCLGHVIALRRTRVAPFDEARCRVALRPCEARQKQGEDALHASAAADRGRAARSCRAQRRPERRRAPAARAGRADPRPRCADWRRGPTYATCKGHLIAVGRIEQGRVAPASGVQFQRA